MIPWHVILVRTKVFGIFSRNVREVSTTVEPIGHVETGTHLILPRLGQNDYRLVVAKIISGV